MSFIRKGNPMTQKQLVSKILALQARRKRCRECLLWGKTTVVAELLYKKGDCDVLFMGINPGREEAKRGIPFCGPSGKILRSTMADLDFTGINVAFSNAILCSTSNERDIPGIPECIDHCNFLVMKVIQYLKPKVLVAVGRSCAQYVFNLNAPITVISGTHQVWEFKGVQYPVIPIMHPASLLYSPSDSGKRSFQRALREIKNTILNV